MASRILLALVLLPLGVTAAEVDFSRSVLPVLSDACFQCHGPDEHSRKAELRLDQKEGIFRTKDDVTVVKPGKVAESELVRRILSDDPEEQMPPPKANRKLKAEEKEVLQRWVEQGAKWGRHWAFEPVKRVDAPAVKNEAQVVNEIDRFIIAKLEERGLSPAPSASPERLLRRVSLDLTGLPPSVEELAAFARDPSFDAYTKVVDRLLASPRFGERLATEWLDVARYADTHGYQMDRPRAMWPWRDWVIKAFNMNLPYDQFVTWQLAGDLLPSPTKEQRLATAFNRLHCQNEEGGIVEEEYRVAYVVDRVDTFGTAFLGLTLECTRCHDHKFDPLTQRDFYSLFSMFQNIDEAGQISYAGFADAMPVPTMLLTTSEEDAKIEQSRVAVAAAAAALKTAESAAEERFATWLANKGAPPLELPGRTAQYAFDQVEGGAVTNLANAKAPGRVVDGVSLVDGKSGKAVALTGENGVTFPGVGHFKRTDPFTLALWLRPSAVVPRAVVLHHSKAPVDAGSRGYEILLEEGRISFGLHYLWPGASLKVTTRNTVPLNEWTHVAVTYDGSSVARGVRVYLNGSPAEIEVIRDNLYKDITYGSEPDLELGRRFRDAGFKGGAVDDLNVFDRNLSPLEVASLADKQSWTAAWEADPTNLSAEQRQGLREYFLESVDEPSMGARRALRAAREAQSKLVQPLAEIMVMQELAQPKPAYILKRGAYDARGEAVQADTPGVLPKLRRGEPRNRLGLAHWLIDRENPLTARVAVNRFWQMLFGRGLVETSDNFGAQGATPTHPELLDWLAGEFVASGWDVKALLRKMVLSATYRESSTGTPELLAADPDDRLLGHALPRRLTAEMLRDQALAVSGLLVERIGGPSVKPYQPAGLWEEIAMGKPHYDQGHGDDLHRRSLYTFWKRTVPPPTMMTFDSAERNGCTVRRQSTSTPLQALALLNDVQFVEAARFVGQRMLREGGSEASQQLDWGFRLVCGRAPTERERAIVRKLYAEQRELFAGDPEAARKLLAFGEGMGEPSLPQPELAAASVTALALLNLDETVNRR